MPQGRRCSGWASQKHSAMLVACALCALAAAGSEPLLGGSSGWPGGRGTPVMQRAASLRALTILRGGSGWDKNGLGAPGGSSPGGGSAVPPESEPPAARASAGLRWCKEGLVQDEPTEELEALRTPGGEGISGGRRGEGSPLSGGRGEAMRGGGEGGVAWRGDNQAEWQREGWGARPHSGGGDWRPARRDGAHPEFKWLQEHVGGRGAAGEQQWGSDAQPPRRGGGGAAWGGAGHEFASSASAPPPAGYGGPAGWGWHGASHSGPYGGAGGGAFGGVGGPGAYGGAQGGTGGGAGGGAYGGWREQRGGPGPAPQGPDARWGGHDGYGGYGGYAPPPGAGWGPPGGPGGGAAGPGPASAGGAAGPGEALGVRPGRDGMAPRGMGGRRGRAGGWEAGGGVAGGVGKRGWGYGGSARAAAAGSRGEAGWAARGAEQPPKRDLVGHACEVQRVGAKFVIGAGNIYISQTVIIACDCPRLRVGDEVVVNATFVGDEHPNPFRALSVARKDGSSIVSSPPVSRDDVEAALAKVAEVLREGDGEPLSPTVVKFVRSVPPVLGARALAELRDALVSADAGVRNPSGWLTSYVKGLLPAVRRTRPRQPRAAAGAGAGA